mgnify:CR=1 FL=1
MTDALSRLIDRGAPTATVRLAADPDDAPRIQAAEKAVKVAERSVVTAKTPEDLQRAENQVELAEAKLAELLDDIVTIDIGLEGIGVWLGLVVGLGVAAVLLNLRFWGWTVKTV